MPLQLVPPHPSTDPSTSTPESGTQSDQNLSLQSKTTEGKSTQTRSDIELETQNGLTRKGTVNVVEGVLGSPGTGKSTWAIARALELSRTPAYVVAHDVGFKIKPQLPDGRPTGVIRHDSTAQCERHLASDARGVHAVSCVDASEVMLLARKISAASLRSNGGEWGIPTVCLIDEVVAAGDANPYRLGTVLKETLTLRRHYHVATIWTCQSPKLAHYQLLCACTRLVCFRLTGARDLEELSKAGLTDEELYTIRNLPDHHFIIHAIG